MQKLWVRFERTVLWRGYRLEWIAALLAIAGLSYVTIGDFEVRALQSCASDFKTMNASAVNLLHGLDAYTFRNIARVFEANGLAEPPSWYGHGPVYPPFTLVLLSPLAAMPMVWAVYLWCCISALALACAIASLARVAGQEFSLGRIWRLVLIGLSAAYPLSGFGLEMGNVSVMVSALSILAVTASPQSRRWPRALGLGVALVLKPHLALWVVIALLLMDNSWRRKLALQATGVAAGLTTAACLVLAVRGQLEMQVAGFRAMLHSELAAGSMNPANHELLAVPSQILSFNSLVGYFPHGEAAELLLVGGFLTLSAASLLWLSTRKRLPAKWRFPITAAWCGFGMIATYHRAHDAVILLILLPWALSCLRDSWKDWRPYAMLATLVMLSVDPTPEKLRDAGHFGDLHALSEFLVYRQAPLGTFFLELILLVSVLGLVLARRTNRSLAQDRAAASAAFQM